MMWVRCCLMGCQAGHAKPGQTQIGGENNAMDFLVSAGRDAETNMRLSVSMALLL